MNKYLSEAYVAKERAELLLSNLEKLKVEGQIEQTQYEAMHADYTARITEATSKINSIKAELHKTLFSKNNELEGFKRELTNLESRFKVGEISSKVYTEQVKEPRQRVMHLENEVLQLQKVINVTSSAELTGIKEFGAKVKKPPKESTLAPQVPLTRYLRWVGIGVGVLVVIVVLVFGLSFLLDSGKQVSTPSVPETTPMPSPQNIPPVPAPKTPSPSQSKVPPPPAGFLNYIDYVNGFSIAYPKDWKIKSLGLSAPEGNTVIDTLVQISSPDFIETAPLGTSERMMPDVVITKYVILDKNFYINDLKALLTLAEYACSQGGHKPFFKDTFIENGVDGVMINFIHMETMYAADAEEVTAYFFLRDKKTFYSVYCYVGEIWVGKLSALNTFNSMAKTFRFLDK